MHKSTDSITETSMRRVVYDRFGDAEVLQLETVELVEPGADGVLVRVAGAGLNPIDWKTRKGLGFAARQIENSLPWTPGYDAAGEVIAVGDNVTTLAPGDKVMGMIGFPVIGGAYAQYAVARLTSWPLCRKSWIWSVPVRCPWRR